jgi:hypothetical protein
VAGWSTDRVFVAAWLLLAGAWLAGRTPRRAAGCRSCLSRSMPRLHVLLAALQQCALAYALAVAVLAAGAAARIA